MDLAAELLRYGPDARPARALSLAESQAYCRQLARSHYENFAVVHWFLPSKLHDDFASIYAYCRWADDLADEASSPAEASHLLDWWQSQLSAMERGEALLHPVFVALSETVREQQLSTEPLHDLLIAFRQDQQKTRYETWSELHDYCRRSANPVGRLVLGLARTLDTRSIELSDSVCTGLQLVNFWQDMRRDFERGRVYLPAEACAGSAIDREKLLDYQRDAQLQAIVRRAVDDARQRIAAGWKLVPRVPKDFRRSITLFVRGGLAICDAIAAENYQPLVRRPKLSKWKKFTLLATSLLPAFPWSSRPAEQGATP